MSSAISIRPRGRRTSSTRFSSPPKLSRLPSSCESPRTLCPQDSDAFAFKPEFLKNWAINEELWKQLPASLQKVVIAVQHAGAAVHTSIERVDILKAKLPEEEPTTTALQNATASDAIAAKLHEHQARTFNRTRSYTRDQEEYNCSPIPKDWRNGSPFRGSQTVDSSCSSTESTGCASPTAQMSPTSLMSPISPQDSFSPFELDESRLPTISRRESEIGIAKLSITRRDSDLFSSATRASSSRRGSQSVKMEVPRDPASSQYYAELEHLRKICLVRLRHSTRPVDIEWGVIKHEPPFLSNSDDTASIVAAKQLKEQFEQCWLQKKRVIAELDEFGKDLCAGIHFSLGWSDTPGLDHEHVELGM